MKAFDNLNLYQVFYKVAATKNISAAAKELFISQPAVSKSISKLESALDTKLFYRNSRGVKLTAEGEILFQQVNEALRSLQYGEDLLNRRNELGMGEITIGVSSTLCKFVLLPMLKEFIKNHPHIKITISCQNSYGTIEKLKNGKADIGLIGEPEEAAGNAAGIAFTPLREIHDMFVTSPAYYHNLMERMGSTAGSIEENATFLLLDEQNMSRQFVQQHLRLPLLHPENIIELSTMDLLIDFAKTDLGIACVIREFVEKELASGELLEYNLDEAIPSRKIGFAALSKISQNPAVEEFLTFMNQYQQ
ncbi:MAG: LysR family transcriptional regulator [Lachnospiraceae bacterium]|nr:LysR family transcriptional regulator [Lachnospiraceae bacterium]